MRFVLSNVYHLGSESPSRIAVENGNILPLEAAESVRAWPFFDMGGRVAISGLVDAHQHLDKTHLFPALQNDSGTLAEAIATVREYYAHCTVDEIYDRAREGLELAIAAGTTALRTHVDTGPPGGVKGIKALLRLRGDYRRRVRLQVVAMARVMPDGTFGEEDVLDAVRLGVDAVGGGPWLATPRRRAQCLTRLFDIACRARLPLDLHVDESDDPADLTLLNVARLARETGLGPRVSAAHCCSLAALPEAEAEAAVREVATSSINVVTLPLVNLYLQGRTDRQPVRRGITRIRELLAAGVNVAAASDNVRDPFYPFGDADLLRLATLTYSIAHLPGTAGMATALQMVTEAPARVIGLARYGLKPGLDADLVVLDLQGPARPADVLSRQPPRFLVLCRGVRTGGSSLSA